MKYNPVINSIIRKTWAIDPSYAFAQSVIIKNLLEGKLSLEANENAADEMLGIASFEKGAAEITGIRYQRKWQLDEAPKNSIAIINIRGSLTKNDQYCGPIGMARIGRLIRTADEHHNVSGIVLQIDSPGGTVDGTERLAEIIKDTKKPVVSFVDGLAASAALWIASATDHIFASTEHDEIGSVGVLLSFADFQPMYEKEGIKFHKIVSDLSPDKTKMFDDIRAGKYEEYKKIFLNPLAEKFQAVIRDNRPNVEEEHLTGKVYFAKDVMGVFVDSIGSIEDAIVKAFELSSETDDEIDLKEETNKNSIEMKKFNNVNKAIGVESLESQDENVSLNEEQLEKIDNALADGNKAKEDLASANDTISENEKTIEDKDAKIAEQEETIKNLQSSAGAEPAKAKKPTETTKVEEKKEDEHLVSDDKSFMDNVNAVRELM